MGHRPEGLIRKIEGEEKEVYLTMLTVTETSNHWIIMTNDLKLMRKEFKLLYMHLRVGTEENQKKPHPG
jgi:hypothetical protein